MYVVQGTNAAGDTLYIRGTKRYIMELVKDLQTARTYTTRGAATQSIKVNEGDFTGITMVVQKVLLVPMGG